MTINQLASAVSAKKILVITALSMAPIYFIYSNASTEPRTINYQPIVSETKATDKITDHTDAAMQAVEIGSEQKEPDLGNERNSGITHYENDEEILTEAEDNAYVDRFDEIADSKIDTETFHNEKIYDSKDIDKAIENDSDFQKNVLEIVRTELAKPREEIGQGLVGIESDEVKHARRVIEKVLDFEEQGITVDLDDLTYVRLGDDVSVGMFGKSKKFARIASHKDDYGNEIVSMGVIPDGAVKEPLSIKAPVSAGFSIEVVASANPYWTDTSYGSIQSMWVKSKDFGEQDPEADYFVYERWTDAKPHTKKRLPTFVRTGDTMSGISYHSVPNVEDTIDYQPHENRNVGSATCEDVTFAINAGYITLEKQFEMCDEIQVRQLWGGLWTRYVAKKPWYRDWSRHYNKQVNNRYVLTLKVKPGTTPYWWDYSDALFCNGIGICSEPSQSVL